MSPPRPPLAFVPATILTLAFVPATVLTLGCFGVAAAEDLIVPDAFATIQAAVDAAEPQDRVVIRPGTYTESIIVGPETSLTLTSTDPSDPAIVASTILTTDADFDRTLTWLGQQGSRISGLTIGGNGMEIDGPTNVTIDRCRFVDNEWWAGSGGALDVSQASVILINCLFRDNVSPDFKGTVTGSAIRAWQNATIDVTGCAFLNNAVEQNGGHGAVSVRNSFADFTNCTFRGNTALNGAGALDLVNVSGVEIDNCIFWDNGPTSLNTSNASGEAENTIFQNGLPPSFSDEGGVSTADPLFDGSSGATLTVDSPAVDAGDVSLLPFDFLDLDADGETVERLPVDRVGIARDSNGGVDLGAMEAAYVANITNDTRSATIPAAIAAATAGDELVVPGGTWFGPMNPGGKDVILRSSDPSDPEVVEATILTAADGTRPVTFNSGETSAFLLDGFTIIGDGVNRGGALRASASSPTIRRCVIRDSFAFDHGGGVSFANGSTSRLVECTVYDNLSSEQAGGMDVETGADISVENTRFIANTCLDDGGAVRVRGATAHFINCFMSGNISVNGIGAVAGTTSGVVHMINCTVVESDSVSTNLAAIELLSPKATITACAFQANSGGSITGSTVATVSYSVVPGGGWPGIGNIAGNAALQNREGPDSIPGTLDDDPTLSASSLAIDAGDVDAAAIDGTVDLLGNARFQDDPSVADATGCANPDAGAAERQTGLGLEVCCPADVDGSGSVGFDDVIAVLAAWGVCEDGDPCDADVDSSGDVAFGDLIAVLGGFGDCP
ncbi:MAG: right-handed parallel beta-helix repeat-containing protein [Phycisphaerales bacterium]